MSLEIIVQEIKVFGERKKLSTQKIQEDLCFRATLGTTTYTSKSIAIPVSPNQLLFDQPFSIFHDSKSLTLYIQIFPPHHSQFDNSNLRSTLFAQFDLTDLSSIIDNDRIETALLDMDDKVVGKLNVLVEVFRQGTRFTQKVTPKILFQVCKQQHYYQLQLKKASQASMNIKQLMVANPLSGNSMMTINYLQVKPSKQDIQLYNRQTFLMIRYGLTNKQYSKLIKVQPQSKESIPFQQEYMQFILRKDNETKFEFFFFVINELGDFMCKAKGEIKYIVFDETINNHCIVMFDRRSGMYGELWVKFVEKELTEQQRQMMAINSNSGNKMDKRIRGQQQPIQSAINQFNRQRFSSINNNRILSQKLIELQMRKLQQEQQKSKPITDPIEIKKRQQHSRFIEFLQKEVIKIQRELKQKQIQQKRDKRKEKYQSSLLVRNQQLRQKIEKQIEKE